MSKFLSIFDNGPYVSSNEGFSRYVDAHDDLYSDGIRPEDPPRLGVFSITCVFGLFILIGYVAAHVF